MSLIVVVSGLGCGSGENDGKVTIVLGHISDMTGPAATALVPINNALDDLARYYNDSDLIPGAELKVHHYDARYDPSRDRPAWEWLKARGAKVMLTPLPTTAETLARLSETEETPLWVLALSDVLLDDPGWTLMANLPAGGLIKTLLKWISENEWDWETKGPAKIGSVGWTEPYAAGCRDAVRDYAQAHPEQFEWVGGYLAPMGVLTWSAEVEGLKNADFLWAPTTGLGIPTFMNQYLDRGYKTTFIGTDSNVAYRSLIVDAVGWDRLDGMLITLPTRWWNETQSPIVSLALESLEKNRASRAQEIKDSGIGYVGSFHQFSAFFEILAAAINDVGPENFRGESFYNTAMGFEAQWDTYEKWDLGPGKPWTWNAVGMYEWNKEAADLVRIDDAWYEAIFE